MKQVCIGQIILKAYSTLLVYFLRFEDKVAPSNSAFDNMGAHGELLAQCITVVQ